MPLRHSLSNLVRLLRAVLLMANCYLRHCTHMHFATVTPRHSITPTGYPMSFQKEIIDKYVGNKDA